MTFRIGKVPENPNACRAGGSTGRCFATTFLELGVEAEVTFVNGSDFIIKISGIVRTGSHAGFTADAGVLVHKDNTVGFVLIGSPGGADTGAG